MMRDSTYESDEKNPYMTYVCTYLKQKKKKISNQTSFDTKVEIPRFNALELQVTYKANRNTYESDEKKSLHDVHI